jgi:hypothetical protein
MKNDSPSFLVRRLLYPVEETLRVLKTLRVSITGAR